MALAMARAWKHACTGIYWLRRAVPADLRTLVGKREEKRTLGTRDPEEAKRKHVEALAELERRWAALRAGGSAPASMVDAWKSLTELEAQELAAWMFDHWIRRHRDNTSEQTTFGAFGPVRPSATEVRVFHFATVFGLIPYRLASVLRLP